MKTNCYICNKELPENNYEIETLETPNFHWDLCLECFIDLEEELTITYRKFRGAREKETWKIKWKK